MGRVVADRFELGELAGSGGMGEVYRATDRSRGETVAVKLVRAPSVQAWERFNREAEMLARLDHPAIVGYVAHGHDGEAAYLAMQWLEGEDLQTRLARGPLGIGEAVTLGERVGGALGAAHALGVVHRDVKPANVFLPAGEVKRATLLDLGVARLAGARLLTRTGMLVGTPGYMAPEQARAERDIDARADVFSLGVLLHECLAGAPLFVAVRVVALLAKVLLEEAPRLLDVRAPLADLVGRMLEKDRDLRPADGARAAEELRGLVQQPERAEQPLWRARPRALTAEEQLLHCVVLGGSDAALATTLAVAVEEGPTLAEGSDLTRLRAVARERGAELVQLADGSLLSAWRGTGGDLARQATRAGRLALALSNAAPERSFALATSRAPLGGRVSVGGLVERAAGHLGESGVAVDSASATLLQERFELAHADGRVTLGPERRVGSGVRTLLGKPTACVGRERELATLEAFLEECIDEPMGRPVLLTAEAGVGKSRVRHELLSRLAEREEVEVWIGRGDPVSAGSTLGVLARALERASGAYAGLPLDERRARVRAFATRHVEGGEGERIAEMLGEMLGAPFDDEASAPLRTARADPRVMADATRRAFEQLVSARAGAAPLVLVVEDLQWGDPSSVSYVDSALRLLGERPWLVLALARPEVHRVFPKLWAGRGLQELRLEPLRKRAARAFVSAALEAPGHDVVERIVTRAAGNAFALEELIRAEAEGRGEDIPDTVLGLAEARLMRLEPESRRVLRAASVFGETFWEGGVRALVGDAMDPTEWLDVLVERELVTPRAESRFADARELVFRHALIRDSSYATLTDADRALGHQLAAEWLVARGEREALVIAEHQVRGGQRARAAASFLEAARQALEAHDLAAVIERAERGLASGASGELAAALRLMMADSYKWRGDVAAVVECARAALEGLTPGDGAWWRAAQALGAAYVRQGARTELEALASDLLETSAADGRAAAVLTLASVGAGMLYLGLPAQSRALLWRASELITPVAHEPQVAVALALAHAEVALHGGDLVAGLEGYFAAVTGYEEAGERRRACIARVNAGYALHELGADIKAEQTLREGLAAAREMGLDSLEAAGLHNLGVVLGRLGRLGEGVRAEREAVDLFEAQGDRRLEGVSRMCLAALLLLEGALDEAFSQARRSVALLGDAAPPVVPQALATLARIELARADSVAAREAAERAWALSDAGAAEIGEAVVRLAYVEALAATGERDAARDAVREAAARLRERAARISDAAFRESFLTKVPENARTLALAHEWGGETVE